jgi:N-acetyl-gamma-glutamyl-phosphate reductase
LTYSVAVAGASGNAGAELLRLIAKHPELELRTVTASSSVGKTVGEVHNHLDDYAERVFLATESELLAGHDIVFLALPHALSAALAKELPADVLVIDCAADFRLESEADWLKFYKTPFAGTWAYGMPELLIEGGAAKQRKNLVAAKRIAVPGCNVTAITLGLAPALSAGLIQTDDIVSVLTVGTSGAGRGATEKLFELEPTGSAEAYQVGGIHRHTPEIEQNLSKSANQRVQISFTPVLSSFERGILAVNTARLLPGATIAAVEAAFEKAYGDEFFIEVLALGKFPTTVDTIANNKAVIGLAIDEHTNRLVTICAIDNLVKGTAGAAIQSMNIALLLDEKTGLESLSKNDLIK